MFGWTSYRWPGLANSRSISNPHDGNQGGLWVYTRSNGVRTQQGSKLVGSGAAGPFKLGSSVSVSTDGNVVIGGGSADNGGVGAAWVFARSNGVWTQNGSKLVASDAIGLALQGSSVSMSADGTTAIVGGPGDDSGKGAAWVFTASAIVPATIASSFVGASFTVAGVGCSTGTYTTPATLNWTPLAVCTVTFSSPQIVAGVQYVFTKWEDNSTNSMRPIAAPTAPTPYTATFGLAPSAGDSGPMAPSRTNQTLVLKFSHPQGYQQLTVVNALINEYLNGNSACYIAYSQPLQVLYLVNDQGPGAVFLWG